MQRNKTQTKQRTVRETAKEGLCLSCEACSVICPKDSIDMNFSKGLFLPEVNQGKCINCGLCLEICPGINPDPHGYAKEKESTFDEKPIACYTAKHKDSKILKETASGGVVSGLIKDLLEKKEYDAAFLLRYNFFNGKPARIKKVTDSEKVIKYARSKYIPASIYEVIRELKENRTENFILVGTACQFQAINNFIDKFKYPRENLLFLGLVCDNTLNFNIYDYYKKKYIGARENIKCFYFKHKDTSGWPGDTRICIDGSRKTDISGKKRKSLKPYFQLKRCLVCLSGKLNPSSDITLGDCWLPGREDKEGVSTVIIRTQKGQKVWSGFLKKVDYVQEDYVDVYNSQGVFNKEATKFFLLEEGSITKLNYVYKKLKICLGRNRHYLLISFLLKFEAAMNKLKRVVQKIRKLIFIYWSLYFARGVSTTPSEKKNNFLIVGGGMFNKGAQAMTFIAVDQIRRRHKDVNIYLCSDKDYELLSENQKRALNFRVIPWNMDIKLGLLGKAPNKKEVVNIVSHSNHVIDVSGYSLGSQWSGKANLEYLLNILVAKKFNVPITLMPQSIGPFDFSFTKKILINSILKVALKYPKTIFAREYLGYELLKKMRLTNVKKSYDMVLLNDSYNFENIFTPSYKPQDLPKIGVGSVGVIPSAKAIKSVDEEFVFDLYRRIVKHILKSKVSVYLVSHSAEDLVVCERIKSFFEDNKSVIILGGDYNAVELEEILSGFSFVVASRYHSVVHCFKRGVPALVLGWANKYDELLSAFDQDYHFDLRKTPKKEEVISSLDKITSQYMVESKKIKDKLKKITANEALFKNI